MATFKCLECHVEIAQRLSTHRGFHAAVVNRGILAEDCARCHSEHNGEDFVLIRWEPSEKEFDHSKTGYVLEGRHAAIACHDCHNASRISEGERSSIKMKNLNRTFLGLSRDCLSCHKDEHRGQLGKDCLACHTFNDWKKAARFDHAKTKFPLTGAHNQVTCVKCHKPEPSNKELVKYVGLAFDKCTACHNDPHRGAFKANCESCHTTIAWKQIPTETLNAKFDHSQTKYPLVGKHATVRCTACHVGAAFNQPVAFGKCADCHKPDPHRGQFLARKDRGDCGACHTLEGFKPAKFGVIEHAATAYPLEAKHASLPCAKCHLPAGAETLYKIKFDQCLDCHKDVHGGQFAGPPSNGRCEACHTVKGFMPSTFTLARHERSSFPLSGGHVAVPCMDCHQARQPAGSSLPVPYRFNDVSCVGCHTDPHKNQFREQMSKLNDDGIALGCEACHSTKSWEVTARFSHDATAFPLSGTHRAVPCIGCHKPPNLEVTMKNVAFTSAPTRCDGCHEDVHANQFAREGRSPRCQECHNTNKWKPSLFDHETRTDFPLRGAHQNVRCAACHKTTRSLQEKLVLFYRPTPVKCAACHGPA